MTPLLRRWPRRTPQPGLLAQLDDDALARLLDDVSGKLALDLGCGRARVSHLLLERGARRVMAVDLALGPLVRRDAFRHPTLLRVNADALGLPFGEGTFHTVVANGILGEIPDLDAAIEELAALISPGGQLVVTDQHPFPLLATRRQGRETTEGRSAHLVSDYIDAFNRWGFGLEALEEPCIEGHPQVLALRARRLEGRGRTPRQGGAAPSGLLTGRPLVSIRAAPKRGVQRWVESAQEQGIQACAALWHMGFQTVGRRFNEPIEHLEPSGEESVVVVTARPGDEMAGLGSTLLAHRDAGEPVTIVHTTDGRRTAPVLGLRRDPLAALRRHEAEEAAKLFGLSCEWLGFEDDTFNPQSMAQRLHAILDTLNPTVVYAPSRVTAQSTVDGVARILAQAIPEGVAELRIYPVDAPLGPALWNAGWPVDVGDLAQIRTGTYTSRTVFDRAALRRRRYTGLLLGLDTPVEAFWCLPPENYRHLHRQAPERQPPFQPLREHPWLDPLAYLRGNGERRRLLRQLLR